MAPAGLRAMALSQRHTIHPSILPSLATKLPVRARKCSTLVCKQGKDLEVWWSEEAGLLLEQRMFEVSFGPVTCHPGHAWGAATMSNAASWCARRKEGPWESRAGN